MDLLWGEILRTTVICEIGSNWKSLDDIYHSCDYAVRLGCLPKLQLWKTTKVVNAKSNPEMFRTMRKYEIPHGWVKRIKSRFPQTFYSVFDLDSVEFLASEIKPHSYKIASPDCVYTQLLKAVAALNQPVFLSVGGATLEEIRAAIKMFNWDKVTPMCCVVDYPCKDAQLLYLRDRVMGSRHIPWGYSSHSTSIIVPSLAVALGAVVIESHFKIGDMDTPDSPHALGPVAFKTMLEYIQETEDNLGNDERPLACEIKNLAIARRKQDGKR